MKEPKQTDTKPAPPATNTTTSVPYSHTTAGRGVIEFLTEALALLPEGWRLRGVRADSGFFDGKLLEFLEGRKLA